MIELTRSQIAELRGCAPSTVSRAKLPRTKSGDYDLSDPVIMEWVISPYLDERIRQMKKLETSYLDDSDEDKVTLEKEKAMTIWKYEQIELLRLKKAREKKDLVPLSLVALWMGYFANGLRTYFFPIGKRVSPGNKELQLKYEEELSKAVKRTLEDADRKLPKQAKEMIGEIETDD